MIENEIFKALADPTRRAIFEKLASGSMNASALRDGMDISQPAMSQHLSVLRSARLVREERRGALRELRGRSRRPRADSRVAGEVSGLLASPD